MSEENVELVRRLYAELASEGSTQEFEQRMSDDALGSFLDPEIEWVPVTESLLAVDSYHGFDGVRRFWGEFLSAWESYRVETLRFDDAGDQVAVVVHIVGRTHELEVKETRSSLLTVRDGRIVRVESLPAPTGRARPPGCRPRRSEPLPLCAKSERHSPHSIRGRWATRTFHQPVLEVGDAGRLDGPDLLELHLRVPEVVEEASTVAEHQRNEREDQHKRWKPGHAAIALPGLVLGSTAA